VKVALATCAALAEGFSDDQILAEALRKREVETGFFVWDDPGVDWAAFGLVVIRSTWDYTRRRDRFIEWAELVGGRLRNPPALIRWNSEKSYLAELERAGLPVPHTEFVRPGDALPELAGELVVKPTVSAGARDTGRFAPPAHDGARALVERLQESGRTAMVQPYLAAVDSRGETAIVFIAGAPSHVLRKRAVLSPDEEAPLRDDALGAAEVMWDPDLVQASSASDSELAAAQEVLDFVAERFGTPLYVRVDLLEDASGRPVVLEVEAVEPGLYLPAAPHAAERLAEAIVAEARATT
jgi:hypothetical protein